MNLFGWWKREQKGNDALQQWRTAWASAIAGDGTSDDELRGRLDGLTTGETDVEVELEMLDALQQLREAQAATANGTLPTVETGHRVVAAEACHFSAPASLASDQVPASGRVLFTGSRAVFVGGGRTSASPWHMVQEVVRLERDVLLGRADGSAAAHFRFNTFGDAVVCAFLAKQLKHPRRPRL